MVILTHRVSSKRGGDSPYDLNSSRVAVVCMVQRHEQRRQRRACAEAGTSPSQVVPLALRLLRKIRVCITWAGAASCVGSVHAADRAGKRIWAWGMAAANAAGVYLAAHIALHADGRGPGRQRGAAVSAGPAWGSRAGQCTGCGTRAGGRGRGGRHTNTEGAKRARARGGGERR